MGFEHTFSWIRTRDNNAEYSIWYTHVNYFKAAFEEGNSAESVVPYPQAESKALAQRCITPTTRARTN
jgi:hypothetical protein